MVHRNRRINDIALDATRSEVPGIESVPVSLKRLPLSITRFFNSRQHFCYTLFRCFSRGESMDHRVRKSWAVSLGVIVAFGTALLGARAQNTPQAASAGAPKTAAQQFKNVQVLKDVPADQLIPAMQFITASLGVDCDYCHVEHAFEKDDKKPKVTARKMMEMMLTINSENFDNQREVTCYTCHQGGSKPVSVPVISAVAKGPEMMAGMTMNASENPVAETLLDNYLKAVGGTAALAKITSRVAKG